MSAKSSDPHRQTLRNVYRAQRDGHWYRAADRGERRILATLHRRGILRRRVRRAARGAYEYRLARVLAEALGDRVECPQSPSGYHVEDNQGTCHYGCGAVTNADSYRAYFGTEPPAGSAGE